MSNETVYDKTWKFRGVEVRAKTKDEAKQKLITLINTELEEKEIPTYNINPEDLAPWMR